MSMSRLRFKGLLLCCLGIGLLSACSDDDDNESQTVRVMESNGIYVIGSGNSEEAIGGSVTYYDYSTKTAADFLLKNGGTALAGDASDAILYGAKLYVVLPSQNRINIYDAASGRQLNTIGATAGTGTFRRITAAHGHIYVSHTGGEVLAYDTVQFQLSNTYQAGSYPEGIAVDNGKLYVANSDNGQELAPSISVIDLGSGTVRTITDEHIKCPQEIAAIGNQIYYLDQGTKVEALNMQSGNGVFCIQGDSIAKVVDATAMAVGMGTDTDGSQGICIYTYNQPLGYTVADYWVYNTDTRNSRYFTFTGVDYPCAIGVDPLTNNVLIASVQVTTGVNVWQRYPDFTSPGYVSIYDTDGAVKSMFDCGVGPVRFAYNIGIKNVEL